MDYDPFDFFIGFMIGLIVVLFMHHVFLKPAIEQPTTTIRIKIERVDK